MSRDTTKLQNTTIVNANYSKMSDMGVPDMMCSVGMLESVFYGQYGGNLRMEWTCQKPRSRIWKELGLLLLHVVTWVK